MDPWELPSLPQLDRAIESHISVEERWVSSPQSLSNYNYTTYSHVVHAPQVCHTAPIAAFMVDEDLAALHPTVEGTLDKRQNEPSMCTMKDLPQRNDILLAPSGQHLPAGVETLQLSSILDLTTSYGELQQNASMMIPSTGLVAGSSSFINGVQLNVGDTLGLYSQKELVFLKATLQPIVEAAAEEECKGESYTSSTVRRGEKIYLKRKLCLASKPGARNSSISTDPQSVAARQRRGRIREKLRELKEMVPGGANMDTSTLLDEAALYVTFLEAELKALDQGTSRLLVPRSGRPHD